MGNVGSSKRGGKETEGAEEEEVTGEGEEDVRGARRSTEKEGRKGRGREGKRREISPPCTVTSKSRRLRST